MGDFDTFSAPLCLKGDNRITIVAPSVRSSLCFNKLRSSASLLFALLYGPPEGHHREEPPKSRDDGMFRSAATRLVVLILARFLAHPAKLLLVSISYAPVHSTAVYRPILGKGTYGRYFSVLSGLDNRLDGLNQGDLQALAGLATEPAVPIPRYLTLGNLR